MLTVTGPIDLPAYGVTVNASNVTSIAQQQIELKYDLRTNDPKRIIVDLIPLLAEKLSHLDLNLYPKLLAVVTDSISKGDLQLWSSDQILQDRIVQLGWSGQFNAPSNDQLALVDANIGGGKTDGVIHEDLHDTISMMQDGSIGVTVELTRTHTGTLGDPFTGSRNRTYHRLYVPLGSTLLSAAGLTTMPQGVFQQLPVGSTPDDLLKRIEGRTVVDEQTGVRINNEFGMTVFGFWSELDPRETKIMRVQYVLPVKLTNELQRYDLTIRQQPGAHNRTYALDVVAPEESRIVWVSDTSLRPVKNFLHSEFIIERTKNLSFVVKLK
jgi:hypothetical protein